MNSELAKDVSKYIDAQKIDQEFSPGSVGRRYEPNEGVNKLNNRIHKESAYADAHSNLPFAFSKPYKSKGRPMYVKCDNCGNITSCTHLTVGIVCKKCKKFSTVSEVSIDW